MTDSNVSRKHRNILVVGHRKDRLGACTKIVEPEIKKKLQELVSNLKQVGEREHPELESFKLRLLAGGADGVDEWSKELATELDIELNQFCLLEEENDKEAESTTYHAVTEKCSNTNKQINNEEILIHTTIVKAEKTDLDYWVKAIDNYKLSLADIVIAVWDGNKPKGNAGGGTVRLVAEAVKQFVPVVWINIGDTCNGLPKVKYLDYKKLTPEKLLSLELNEASVERLANVFTDANNTSESSECEVYDLVKNVWDKKHYEAYANFKVSSKKPTNFALVHQNKKWQRLSSGILDPQERLVRAGHWYSEFISFFYKAKEEKPKKKQSKPSVFTQFLIGEKTQAYPPQLYKDKSKDKDQNQSKQNSLILESDFQALWSTFKTLDRVALLSSKVFRDQIVLSGLLPAIAVLGSVWGIIAITHDHMFVGATLEMFALLMVAWNVNISRKYNKIKGEGKHKFMSSHDVWLSSRQAAEALKLSIFLAPQLGVLPPLYRKMWEMQSGELHLNKEYSWISVQAIKEEGLSFIQSKNCLLITNEKVIEEQKDGLKRFIDDQADYHKKNAAKNDQVNEKLTKLLHLGYYLALLITSLQLLSLIFSNNSLSTMVLEYQNWLLLITSFLPALLAGLYSVQSSLELKRIAMSSKKMESKLNSIKNILNKEQLGSKLSPRELHSLSFETARIMYEEFEGWAELMESQDLDYSA